MPASREAERRCVVRWPSARACRPEVGVPLPASREAERRCVVRWPSARACRPEVGVPVPVSREAERRALAFGAGARADRRSAFPCLRLVRPCAAFGPRVPTGGRRSLACLVRQSGEASCADRRSAFPCLRLVRESGDVLCAGLRPARADRRSAFPCQRLVRENSDAAVPCLRAIRGVGVRTLIAVLPRNPASLARSPPGARPGPWRSPGWRARSTSLRPAARPPPSPRPLPR